MGRISFICLVPCTFPFLTMPPLHCPGTFRTGGWLAACTRDGISSSKACGLSHPAPLSTQANGIAAALLPDSLGNKGSFLNTPLVSWGTAFLRRLLFTRARPVALECLPLNVCVNGLCWTHFLLPERACAAGGQAAGGQAAPRWQELSQEEGVASQGSLEAQRGIHEAPWEEPGSQTEP